MMNFNPREDDALMEQVPEEMVTHILTFLDVPTLVQKKPVCRLWQDLCTTAIDQKAPIPRMVFETNEELCDAVKYYTIDKPWYKADNAEKFAATYGWPINKWDVSRVKDLTYVFAFNDQFNESIGSWNISNAIQTHAMFCDATRFNQDISSWDTSNVTNMSIMFSNARSFNQDISSWGTSNVTNMKDMFSDALSFNQDLSSWDVSNVGHIRRQDISCLKRFAKRRKLRASTESQRTGGSA
jgi:surface protein